MKMIETYSPNNRKAMKKVVKIIDEYHVVINAGRSDGVVRGDTFQICAPEIIVKDPDTKAVLGTLSHTKATIVVTDVYEQMSVCQNKVTVSAGTLASIADFSRSMSSTPAQLKVDPQQISGGFDDVIRVGDIVQRSNRATERNQASSSLKNSSDMG